MARKKRKTAVHGHSTARHAMPRNHCFGCGKDNPQGMKLKFFLDEERQRFVGRIRLARRYQGPPGHAHGGIIATVLDEAMGKVNKLRGVVALTSQMRVEYFKPVPLSKPLVVEGWERRVRGREHINVAELRNQKGELLARGWAKFIAIDPEKMFARYIKNGRAR